MSRALRELLIRHVDGGTMPGGVALLVPAACKTADSFFPGFWDGLGWGFGVAVQTEGPQRGRIG